MVAEPGIPTECASSIILIHASLEIFFGLITSLTESTKISAPAPATVNQALEHAYQNAAMTDFHQYRAKVTGYTPAPNRYFVRRTAPVGTVTTTSWHSQKATVAGYTQPSNQYFATRARLAYHPPEKTFTGYDMKVEGVPAEAQTQSAPPPEPPKSKGTLPKGMEQSSSQQAPPPPQAETTYASDDGKSRQEKLEDYEKDYLQRLEQQRADAAAAAAEAAAAEAQAKASQTRGTLPKGFEPPAPPAEEKPQSRGTLPKGF